ncbi:MAG: PQQ-binding-like beta-propeller repeat protein [Deltaproteobacteria bacterium]|nr:PQQ-binding-like beta-propeller repeat protein [Deltaproteobacteria bacterium]
MSVTRLVLAALLLAASSGAQTPNPLPPPARTEWRPQGCRAVSPATSPFASRNAWRTLHSDERNSDEVEVAYAPRFHAGWVAEADTWNPTGPVFDSAGNLYFAPYQSREGVAMISLDAQTGARRWAVPAPPGTPVGGAPLVLQDPDSPGSEILYQARHDRALAVRTDGSVVWEVATGVAGPIQGGGFGANYHPGADAIVGLTRDGYLYALDRRSGAPLLATPFQLPGEPAPPGPPSTTPAAVVACAQEQLEQFFDLGGAPLSLVIDVLLGNGVEVANYFSVDAASGRMWVAATAPDAEDGAVDGVSQLGALYGLDLVPTGGGWQIIEACHRSFTGGSASTPALSADGGRIYVGDNVGNLFALERDCRIAWSVALGSQITGSIGVASDNGEIYASTGGSIFQVIDQGSSGTIAWSADLASLYTLPAGQIVANQTIVGIGANAVSFQAGAALPLGANRLTITTGVGLLDRRSGAVRSFSPGLEESVAVMSTGPDGALYMGHSPLRRLFAYCIAELGLLPLAIEPPIGGIRKWEPLRLDYQLRDAVCAAADRTANAAANRRACPDSASADIAQARVLVAQGRRAAATAVADGNLSASEQMRLERRLARIDRRLADGRFPVRLLASCCRRAERAVANDP